jgi:CDP-glucose 4,6-dehydratase
MNNILTLRKFWKGKKVFLTGHTGSKGSWFFTFLNVLEAKVTGYSLKLNIKLNLFDLIKLNKRLETSIIDNVKEYK